MISVNISLYGNIAKYAGGKHIATIDLEMEEPVSIKSILDKLQLPKEEKGYLFINSVLCDVPGLNASLGEPLKNGDHIGIFSTTHMWPYQYRNGVPMSDALKKAQAEHGVMRNSYRTPK